MKPSLLICALAICISLPALAQQTPSDSISGDPIAPNRSIRFTNTNQTEAKEIEVVVVERAGPHLEPERLRVEYKYYLDDSGNRRPIVHRALDSNAEEIRCVARATVPPNSVLEIGDSQIYSLGQTLNSSNALALYNLKDNSDTGIRISCSSRKYHSRWRGESTWGETRAFRNPADIAKEIIRREPGIISEGDRNPLGFRVPRLQNIRRLPVGFGTDDQQQAPDSDERHHSPQEPASTIAT